MRVIGADTLLYLRSLLFLIWFVGVSIVLHLAALPTLVLPWPWAVFAARTWGEAVLWGLRVFAGLGYEVRGNRAAAAGRCWSASKHYSMWEAMAMMALLPRPAMVMKQSLFRIPFYGWYSTQGADAFGRPRSGARAP